MFEDTNQAEINSEDTNPTCRGILPFDLFPNEGATLQVKFNGEDREIPLDEAKILTQKGLNYDHVYAQRESAHQILDLLAQREGLSRGEYIRHIEDNESADELRWSHLLDAYPDLEAESLPDEVYLATDAGLTPLEAYQKHLIADLKARLEAIESAEKNKERAIGSLASSGADTTDSFLDGFFGAKY